MTNEHEQRLHEQLCAYVLGECSSEERLEIERELMRSPELRAQRDTIERTVGLVKNALSGGEALSPEAAETVFSAASASKPTAWQAVPWLRIAAGLGAVALGVAIVQQSGERAEVETARYDVPGSVKPADARRNKSRVAADASGVAATKDPAGPAGEKGENEMLGFFDNARESGSNGLSEKKLGESSSLDRKDWKLADQSTAGIAPENAPALDDTQSIAFTPKQEGGLAQVGLAKAQTGVAVGQSVTDGSSAKYGRAGGGTYRGPGDATPPAAASPTPTPDADGGGGASGSDTFFFGAGALKAADGKKADSEQMRGFAVPSARGSGPSSQSGSGAPTVPASAATGGTRPPATAPMFDGSMSLGYTGPAEKAKAPPEDRSGRSAVPRDTASMDVRFAEVQLTEDLDTEEPILYYKLPVADQQVYLDRECRRILDGCVRRPNERPRDMYFRFWGDNPFEVTALDPLSTFSADVDTASYTLARRFLNEQHVPEKAQIRTEEFVNYFKSDVPAPTSGVFAIQTNLAPSRFSTDTTRQMMRVVVRGKDLSKVERSRLNLTFVVDVSGSMREQNRLEMVKHSMRLLAMQLGQYDRIGIVKFSTDASVVLPLTAVADRARIESAIEPLQPEGSTNSNAGLELGYGMALGGLDPEATNRVVFLSDGVANVGETDPAKIAERVKPMREKGIYLNTIGVGMNNHNDVLLEQLADKSDGMCSYIDSPDEAKRALVDNFTGTFQPIARDVKIQVDFDSSQVLRYRLLGYENRAIADADFRNDKFDAGELGAGHQVTALYEIERQSTNEQSAASEGKPLATVRVRWKEPRNFGKVAEQDTATEIAHAVSSTTATTFEGAGQSYRKSVLAAQFAEILRRSVHARGDSLDDLLNESLKLQKEIPTDADFNEFVMLVSKSKDLILRTMPVCDDLCQAIDSVRETYYRRAQLEQLQHEMDQKMVEDLKRQNDELETRLREIVRRRLENRVR